MLYSLSDVTVGDQSIDFVGLKNFRDALDNATFRTALQNTFVFTIVSQAIVLVLANILALVLSADFHGKRLVRFLVLLPWTTPIALGVLGWLWTLDNVYSPIDYVMRQVGLLGVGSPLGPDWFGTNSLWLAYPDRARLSVLIVHVWRTLPLATVILLAGLTGDPAGHQGRGERRRRRVLPPAVRHPHPAAAADHGGGGALRHRLHLHRHDRRLHPHPRRSLRFDAGAGELGLLQGDRRREPGPGRGDRAVPLPGAGRRGGADAENREAGGNGVTRVQGGGVEDGRENGAMAVQSFRDLRSLAVSP